jgi:ethanolamine utilization microcompartment shell protein EutL
MRQTDRFIKKRDLEAVHVNTGLRHVLIASVDSQTALAPDMVKKTTTANLILRRSHPGQIRHAVAPICLPLLIVLAGGSANIGYCGIETL